MMIFKIDIQKLITKNGKKIPLKDLTWRKKTATVLTTLDGYTFNFKNINHMVIMSGHNSTIDAGHNSTIKAGHSSKIDSGCYSTINAGCYSTIKARSGSTINAGYFSTIDAGHNSTIKAGHSSKIDAGYYSTINAGSYSTINAGCGSMINAGPSSTINARDRSVIVRRDVFEMLIIKRQKNLTIAPYNIPGYVSDGVYSVTGKPAIIADGILSEIISKKQGVYKVINYGESKVSYLIERDGVYSHGETLLEAKRSLMYKIGNRDTSYYNDYTLDTVLTTEDAIKMYRTITGACETGTRYFVNNLKKVPKKLTVRELINLTRSQYNNGLMVKFFENKQ